MNSCGCPVGVSDQKQPVYLYNREYGERVILHNNVKYNVFQFHLRNFNKLS
ncbi:MAG: hypothetical protein BWX87_02364 [Bacteroidetes bacterium ADurb.Bin123]|nr:MAG: hypothetical protein BWX87_02364 [Bacteroidetes bacterium ADurb.Bin123]